MTVGVLPQLGVHLCLVGREDVLGHSTGEGDKKGGERVNVAAVRVLMQQEGMVADKTDTHTHLCPGVLLGRAAALVLVETEQVSENIVGVDIHSYARKGGVCGCGP